MNWFKYLLRWISTFGDTTGIVPEPKKPDFETKQKVDVAEVENKDKEI